MQHLDFGGEKVMFVASTGGHLAQLHRMSSEMNASTDSCWITFDTPQSRTLLRGKRVSYVPYIKPRGVRQTIMATPKIAATIRRERPSAVVSTGAAVAISAFLPARLRSLSTYYIESVSRTSGPSLTGRIAARLHLARLRTQHVSWATSRWEPYPSVLAAYDRLPANSEIPSVPKIFVTLGTIEPYRFDALIDALARAEIANSKTIWQVGATKRENLPGTTFESISSHDFDLACKDADVVITHAGVGTVLKLLELGKFPVVVPRRHSRGEHVDDHQEQICALLEKTGLGMVREVSDIDASVLEAIKWRVAPKAV